MPSNDSYEGNFVDLLLHVGDGLPVVGENGESDDRRRRHRQERAERRPDDVERVDHSHRTGCLQNGLGSNLSGSTKRSHGEASIASFI